MDLFEHWRSVRRRRQLRTRLAEMQQTGEGLHLSDWRLMLAERMHPHDVTPIEPILAWCREVLASCRRPWGIDHFDLVLSWRHADYEPPRRARLRGLRPADLYGPDHLAARLMALLGGAEAVHVAAGLFSWGDAAHAMTT
jgi:hypothetical protein